MNYNCYWDYELKTKQDFINLFNEINVYRELDGEDFDFGTGLIKNKMSYGSEDAYYEMDLQFLWEIIEYWEDDIEITRRRRKKRENKYIRNRRYKDKLWAMIDKDYLPVWNSGKWFEEDVKYPKRYYRRSCSKFLKRVSNRKIRRHKGHLSNGFYCHEIYGYWWNLD